MLAIYSTNFENAGYCPPYESLIVVEVEAITRKALRKAIGNKPEPIDDSTIVFVKNDKVIKTVHFDTFWDE